MKVDKFIDIEDIADRILPLYVRNTLIIYGATDMQIKSLSDDYVKLMRSALEGTEIISNDRTFVRMFNYFFNCLTAINGYTVRLFTNEGQVADMKVLFNEESLK